LRDISGIPERERLRGSFKYTWSKNMRALSDLGPAFEELEIENIPFRLIKGAAVQLLFERVGARTMGDVDLLVHEADIDRVADILVSHGFRQNTSLPCPGHRTSEIVSYVNFNKGPSHVDVHLAGAKEPIRLLRTIMLEPGVRVRIAGASVEIPVPELLLLHAASHGSHATGPTDLMQAALDITLLRNRTDARRLVTLARRTRTIISLRTLDRHLESLEIPGSGVIFSPRIVLMSSCRHFVAGIKGALTTAIPIIHRIAVRYPGRATGRTIRQRFPGHQRAYRMWLATGKFAVSERLAMSRWGGFLAEPTAPVEHGQHAMPFVRSHPAIVCSPVPSAAFDWRFRFQVPSWVRALSLEFRSNRLDGLDPIVYVNGVPVSRLVAGDSSSRRIRLSGFGSSFEVSLRPLGNACEDCFPGLDDLEIVVEFEAQRSEPEQPGSSRRVGADQSVGRQILRWRDAFRFPRKFFNALELVLSRRLDLVRRGFQPTTREGENKG
ncbi:MAG: nucleotidyltransferase family protein, partial [Actinomycetota bacterium]